MRQNKIIIPLISFILFYGLLLYTFSAQATIYVSMEDPVIATWPDNADGNTPATTIITGGFTNLNTPYSIDVDGDFLYVLNYGGDQGVTVYPREANGNVAPLRQIPGTSTTKIDTHPEGLHVDGNRIYVIDNNQIVIFPIEANGDVPPERVITSSTLVAARKIKVDSNWIYVSDIGDESIKVFDINANGNTAPTRTIQGGLTGLAKNYGIAIDSSWIYALNYASEYSVRVFRIDDDGNVAPTRTIEGTATTLNQPYGIAVDSNWIYVANYNNQSIDVFPIDAEGDIAPTRTIVGSPLDQRLSPSGIAVYNPDQVPVPTISQWGLIILALLIFGSVVWVFWRRRNVGIQ